MILGVGCDITKVSRFKKWLHDKALLTRFFNEEELPAFSTFSQETLTERKEASLLQHIAARFAAKESFSKALGTGLTAFNLRDAFIKKDSNGAPSLVVTKTALTALNDLAKRNHINKATVHISLSHEKEFAVAFCVIEGD